MRSLSSFAFVLIGALLLSGVAGAAGPTTGSLNLDRGRGLVVLEVKGVVLGRLASGTITVTDRTPTDPYAAKVTGRRIAAQRKLGPARVFVRGQGLRFSLLGGSYRIAVRGSGISLSVVGRGTVTLDGEPRFAFDDLGVYSLEEGVDCSVEPASCTPLTEEPLRLKIEPPPPEPVPLVRR